MNTAYLIDIAKGIIPDLTLIKDDLYKGTLNIENKVAGIYYIDMSNKPLDDFELFQEDLLSDEFYGNPGSLQWNYYLFMLNDKFSQKQRSVIEKNDRYARKFIFDEKEFEDFFRHEEAGKINQTNIVAEWKTALEDVDLQEVYTDASYVDIFNRFSANTTKKNEAGRIRKVKTDATKITFVNRLLLKDTYRKQPSKIREFEFAKVNLVKGINGAGKTSIFEAIELVLCGRSIRNSSFKNADGCIEAQFNNERHVQKYQHSNNQLFQARDFSWYGSTYPQGNYLFNSFNRFNYFNADAAHDFASSSTDGQIRDALFNIVLGPEFGYIEERSQKMLERIRPEYNKIKGILEEANKEVIRTTEIIENYKEPDHLKFIIQKVNENINGLNLFDIDLDITTNSSKIEDLNNQIYVIATSFANSDFIYNSISDFEKAEKNFASKKKEYKRLIDDIKLFNQEMANLSSRQSQTEQILNVINRSIRYLSDERMLALNGIDAKIKENEFNLHKIDFARQQLKGIVLSKYYNEEATAPELERKYREKLGFYKKEIHKKEDILRIASEKLGRIDQLITEIKKHGKEYLKLNSTAVDCPMCQSSFERNDLEYQILSVLIKKEKEPLKKPLDLDELEQLRIGVTEIEQNIIEITKLNDTYQGYFAVDSLPTLSYMIGQLEILILSRENLNGILKKLKELLDFAELAGLSEKELKELKFKIENSFDHKYTFSPANLENLNLEKKNLERSLGEINLKLEDIKIERQYKGMEVKRILNIPPETPLSTGESDRILNQQENELEIFKAYFEKLNAIIRLGRNDLVSEYKRKSEVLNENIRSYKEGVQGQILLSQAKSELKKNNQHLKDNGTKFIRFEKAYFKLKELTSGQASDHVDKFFEHNFTEIFDIFKNIHVPKEFIDIKFVNGKKLILIDKQGKERSVSEISTGQRSALALSIFLSLNKKLQNGPDIIMFDDPVAFIDDLNALSFIDYLRMYVLSSGKQIFFATANMRLAHLFEKKFSFLENDFKHWHLVR